MARLARKRRARYMHTAFEEAMTVDTGGKPTGRGATSGDGSEPIASPPSVSQALAAALGELKADRERHRLAAIERLDPDAQSRLKRIEVVAWALIQGAGDLASPAAVPLHEAMGGLPEGDDPAHRQDPAVVLLSEAMQHLLGRQVVEMAERAEQRIWKLLILTQRVRPSPRAAAILRRVSRCYVYGFDPECAVMCRSALDAEFEAEITDEMCAAVLGESRRPRRAGVRLFDLCDRIAVAKKLGRISPRSGELADGIRQAGNEVVHEGPRGCDDAFGTIADTMDVIGELSA